MMTRKIMVLDNLKSIKTYFDRPIKISKKMVFLMMSTINLEVSMIMMPIK